MHYFQVMYSGRRHLGYGFVTFRSSQSAFNAINALNRYVCYNKTLHVSVKTTKAENNLAKIVSNLITL